MKQLCNIVMLPTNEASSLVLNLRTNLLEKLAGYIKENAAYKPQHLYITSSESPSIQGDWMFYGNKYSIKELHQFQKGIDSAAFLKEQGIRKVIATTNKNITRIAQIPESFIKKFVESNGSITEVLVEYEAVFPKFGIDVEYAPKLREDNTIIISPSKSYTREDLAAQMKACGEFGYLSGSMEYDEFVIARDKWIEENL